MDIGQIRNNKKFYEGYEGEPEIIFEIKEKPEYNIHIWEGYIEYDDIKPYKWQGMTRDYEEMKGPWSKENYSRYCIVDTDDYLSDLKSYNNRKYQFDEEKNAIDCITMLFEYAKEQNYHVQIMIN